MLFVHVLCNNQGIDIPNVEVLVVYGTPSTIAQLYQVYMWVVTIYPFIQGSIFI